jgi:hypothetical protein
MNRVKLFFCSIAMMVFLLQHVVLAGDVVDKSAAIYAIAKKQEGNRSIAAQVVEHGSTMQHMQNIVTFCCNHSYVLSGIGLAFLVGSSLYSLYEYCRNYSAQQCPRPVIKPLGAEIDSVGSQYGIDG